MGSFHFDDYSVLSGNVWRTLSTRPLTAATFWLNRSVEGQNPVGYHAVNLALHLTVVVLVFVLLRRIVPFGAAFTGALIFAVHPMQAEAVNYTFARSSVLEAMFCVLAMLAWTIGHRWWTLAFYGAALTSKTECVAFPFVLLLFELCSKRDRRNLAAIGSMVLLSVIAGLVVLTAAARTPGSQAGPRAAYTPVAYAAAQGPVIWRYLRMLILLGDSTWIPRSTCPPALSP
jgi:protein O-mannosyl-transferase